VKLLLDTIGGERGAKVIVEAGLALQAETGIEIQFLGHTAIIQENLRSLSADPGTIRIVAAEQSVSMDEFAGDGLSDKPDASVLVAMREISAGRVDGFISPGHSGATVVAAREILGLLPGVVRPGLCQVIPMSDRYRGLLMDAGATVTCTTRDLIYFAAMAVQAAPVLLDFKTPTIGLLNNGSEPCKGNRGLIEVNRALRAMFPNFIGNIEGNHIWSHRCDIVITDGLTGNIVLKSAEGLISMFPAWIPHPDCDPDPRRMHYSPDSYGGSVLLGVDGVCIVCHGQADVDAVISAGRVAADCIRGNLTDRLKQFLNEFQITVNINEELTV